MSTIAAFVLGLLAGWVIEWIIDWIYWRRRLTVLTHRIENLEAGQSLKVESFKSETTQSDLEKQLKKLESENAILKERITTLEAQDIATHVPAATAPPLSQEMAADFEEQTEVMGSIPNTPKEKVAESPVENPAEQVVMASRQTSVPIVPDDLIVIKGIGPVINKKLNDAGIFTFRQLAEITPERLREIVGDVIQQLANEQDIINQAKELAAGHDQAANS